MKRVIGALLSIPHEIYSNEPLLVGRALTKVFLIGVGLLALLPQHTEAGGWQIRIWSFLTSPANEIGDTFAGLAGVLAFMWIIITVWLQSEELRAQRQELKLTRIEFKRMAEAQDKQVEILTYQSQIFSGEQQKRQEDRAQADLEAMVRFFRVQFMRIVREDRFVDWIFKLKWLYGSAPKQAVVWTKYEDFRTDDEFLIFLSNMLDFSPRNMPNFEEYAFEGEPRTSNLTLCVEILDAILDLENDLSVAQIVRLETLGLKQTQKMLQKIILQPAAYCKAHTSEKGT